MRRFVLPLVLLSSVGCWQPPDLPPPVPAAAPSEATLLGQRPYTVSVPSAYSDRHTWPLFMVLHGYGGTGDDSAEYLGVTELAKQHRAFLVAPNGQLDSRHFRAWHPGAVHEPFWDVEYLLAIIHDLKARYRIDAGRVFIIGESQGAHMAHRLGCDGADEVAAVATLAGQLINCQPTRAVSVMQVHGTADAVIGYDGDIQNDPPDSSIPSAHKTMASWARADHCTGAIEKTGQTLDLAVHLPGVDSFVEAYPGCPFGIDVQLWTITDGNHTPDFTPEFPGLMYDFLEGHARTRVP